MRGCHPDGRRPYVGRPASTSKDLRDELDVTVIRTDLGVDRTPLWWRLVGVVQWLLVVAALVGAGWLALLAFGSYLRLPEPETPDWHGFSVPTLLLVGGVLLGLGIAAVGRFAGPLECPATSPTRRVAATRGHRRGGRPAGHRTGGGRAGPARDRPDRAGARPRRLSAAPRSTASPPSRARPQPALLVFRTPARTVQPRGRRRGPPSGDQEADVNETLVTVAGNVAAEHADAGDGGGRAGEPASGWRRPSGATTRSCRPGVTATPSTTRSPAGGPWPRTPPSRSRRASR